MRAATNIHFVVRENRLRKFKDQLFLFDRYIKSLRGDLLRQEAALTALEFINRTSPIKPAEGQKFAGLYHGAKKQGERAVEMDIRTIFKPTDFMLAGAVDVAYGSLEAFQRWKRRPLPNGSNDVIRRIWAAQDEVKAFEFAKSFMGKRDIGRGLGDEGQMRSVHERERRASRLKGRIIRGGGPSSDIKGPPYRPYFADANVINRYVRDRQKMVGKAKAGWWEVIRGIGSVTINGKTQQPTGSRVPQWVKRNASGKGFFNRDPAGRRITIINSMGNINGIAVESRTVEQVIESRNARLNSNPYLQREVDRAVRMWNKGLIPGQTR